MRTEITGPAGSRRMVRVALGRRGGVRNAGTTSPAARAAAPTRRAISANPIAGPLAVPAAVPDAALVAVPVAGAGVRSISRIEYVG